eukprot:1681164-Amphidinium_carterae.1
MRHATSTPFMLPPKLSILEAQIRSDLLKGDTCPKLVKQESVLQNAFTVVQVLTIIFRQYMPSENASVISGLATVETPLKNARTFREALLSLRKWSQNLRICIHDIGAKPEPYRLYVALGDFCQDLTKQDPMFGNGFYNLVKESKVEIKCDLAAVLMYVEGLEKLLLHHSTRED